jgi:hypothetical protein
MHHTHYTNLAPRDICLQNTLAQALLMVLSFLKSKDKTYSSPNRLSSTPRNIEVTSENRNVQVHQIRAYIRRWRWQRHEKTRSCKDKLVKQNCASVKFTLNISKSDHNTPSCYLSQFMTQLYQPIKMSATVSNARTASFQIRVYYCTINGFEALSHEFGSTQNQLKVFLSRMFYCLKVQTVIKVHSK